MSNIAIRYLWGGVCALFVIWAWLLRRLSEKFSYAFHVPDMPIQTFVVLLMIGGAIYCILPLLIRRSEAFNGRPLKILLGAIYFTGLFMRLLLMQSEPMLEDDYQRYMWDGAVVAHGINPYSISPEVAGKLPSGVVIGGLAQQSGLVLGRVNHPELRTVYPAVAQLFFAAAYLIAPFDLLGWRMVILLVDFCVAGLLLLLLKEVGRSGLWIALYWLNPVVVKEFFNSAHMDVLIVPFVLGAIYLTLKGRVIPSLVALAFAVGVKIWPIFLLPILVGESARRGVTLKSVGVGIGLFGLFCLGWLWPVLVAGFDHGSGFVAYAAEWQTNSALFPAIENAVGWVIGIIDIPDIWAGRGARILVVVLMGVWALYLARRALADGHELILSSAFLVLVVMLLSPAQFPWYLTWFAPFLVFLPLMGAMVLHMTIVVYYMGFHYMVIDDYKFYTNVVVWLAWVPVWGLLIFELFYLRKWSGNWSDYLSRNWK